MDALEAIGARTSVRSFHYREVDDALLLSLLRAAVRAPFALEREPWAFAIVQDRTLLRRISDRAHELWAVEAQRRAESSSRGEGPAGRFPVASDAALFHNAGCLIVIGARPNEPYADAECWMAAENLQIAATALGLGSCVVGAAASVLADPALRSEIGLSPTFRPIVPIVVGHPRERPTPRPRRDPEIIAWRR